MTPEIHDKYETANITLAATLACMNYHLQHVKVGGRNGTMGFFCFSQVPNALLMQFDQGSVRVDPTMFHVSLKRLTSMVKGIVNG